MTSSNPSTGVARLAFGLAVIGIGAFAFIGGMGRGIGLLIGVLLVAVYGVIRGDRLGYTGYVALTVGLVAVAVLWYWVPLTR